MSNLSEEMEEIVEGSASMLYSKDEAVFYNKVQVFNRDMTIHVLNHFAEIRKKEYEERIEKKKAKYIARNEDYSNNEFINKPYDGMSVLDALAATGLRSIRYFKEINHLNHLTINDLDSKATDQAKINLTRNGCDMKKVTVHNEDATLLMYMHRSPDYNTPESAQYDVIDLDPYGTAAPFLDAAVQSVRDGGLLAVTCTDAAVLCGTYPEKCYALYGSMPMRGTAYHHEMSLRVLLHAIESAATKYRRYIVPWISLSVDFYVRVFVRVYQQPVMVKESCTRQCYVSQSVNSPTFYISDIASYNEKRTTFDANHLTLPSTCPESGTRMRMAGPFWSQPIHDQGVVDALYSKIKVIHDQITGNDRKDEGKVQDSVGIGVGDESGESSSSNNPSAADASIQEVSDFVKREYKPSTTARMVGILGGIRDELKDVPFYYVLPHLASTIKVTSPKKDQIRAALINAGYRFSVFHHEAHAVKTDAPPSVIWDIMRCYARDIAPPTWLQNRVKDDNNDVDNKGTAVENNGEVNKGAGDSDNRKGRSYARKNVQLQIAETILLKEPTLEAVFTLPEGTTSYKQFKKDIGAAIFPVNPASHWGPKRRAGRLIKDGEKEKKQNQQNQQQSQQPKEAEQQEEGCINASKRSRKEP